MRTQIIFKRIAQGFILFSGLALLFVSLMALFDPQSVMDLVGVRLTNTDAYSSIRGIYGGAGLSLFIGLIYLMCCQVRLGLAFLGLLWGLYAFSRIVTIFLEGPLGSFGRQWLVIELTLCVIAIILLCVSRKERDYMPIVRYEKN